MIKHKMNWCVGIICIGLSLIGSMVNAGTTQILANLIVGIWNINISIGHYDND